jgi:hypothetical protein
MVSNWLRNEGCLKLKTVNAKFMNDHQNITLKTGGLILILFGFVILKSYGSLPDKRGGQNSFFSFLSQIVFFSQLILGASALRNSTREEDKRAEGEP